MNKKTRRLLSLLLGGGRYKTLSGVPPLTFTANGSALKNYRIYGNTVNGENVGDLITEGEHAGEYKVPVTVEGKNLLQNTTTSQTINGVTFTVNEDGSVTCNGTASNAAWFPVNRSFDLYAPEGRIASIANNGSMSTFYMNISYIGNVTTSRNYSSTTHQNVYVQLVIAAGYTCDNLTFYPMIRKASITDDTYEPYRTPVTTPIYLPEQIKMVGDEAEYIDYGEQKQHRVRKNLLKNTATSQTINGLTYTVNTDGSVTCNGRREQTSTFFKIGSVTTSGEIILSGCPSGGSSASFAMRAFSATVSNPRDYYDIGDGCMLNIPDTYNIYIRIQSDYTCDNLTFYPMIRKAAIEDDTYEPYIENTDLDVTLPALPTLSGTNTLSVGTEVQPSAVEIRGRISAVQTALNMAALSPVSMSMPDGFAVMSESEEVVNYADNQGAGQEQSED